MGKRRSKNSLKGFRARRLGDVQHLVRCRERFDGPPVEGDFEAMVFIDGRALGKQLQLTNAEREQYRISTIKPFDKTDAELKAIRLAKKRESERLRRRERGAKARVPIGKPWLSEGVSKSAWYKRRARETERGRHRETERGRHETERGLPSLLPLARSVHHPLFCTPFQPPFCTPFHPNQLHRPTAARGSLLHPPCPTTPALPSQTEAGHKR